MVVVLRRPLKLRRMINKIDKAVNAMKNQQIAVRKKISGEPLESKRDRLRLSSNMGPRINAIKNGAAGRPKRSMKKPRKPSRIMTSTSNMELLTA